MRHYKVGMKDFSDVGIGDNTGGPFFLQKYGVGVCTGFRWLRKFFVAFTLLLADSTQITTRRFCNFFKIWHQTKFEGPAGGDACVTPLHKFSCPPSCYCMHLRWEINRYWDRKALNGITIIPSCMNSSQLAQDLKVTTLQRTSIGCWRKVWKRDCKSVEHYNNESFTRLDFCICFL
jgi:hypothetical protein